MLFGRIWRFFVLDTKHCSGPVELGGRWGDRPPNILRILPIFPEIISKIVKIWVILGFSPLRDLQMNLKISNLGFGKIQRRDPSM